MPKKKLIFSLFLVFIMSLVLTGCGGGGSSDETLNEVEKEEIRMEINNVINDFDTTDTTVQESINKVDAILTADAVIEVSLLDGTHDEFNKNDYLIKLSESYATVDEIISQIIDDNTKSINVLSPSEATVTFKITTTFIEDGTTYQISEVDTYYFVKINSQWYVNKVVAKQVN